MKGFLHTALLASLPLAFMATPVAAASVQGEPFQALSIDLDFNISRTPLSADLTPHPGKEIVVFGRNEAKAHQVAVLAVIDGRLQQVDRFAIGEEYFAYDISEQEKSEHTLYFLAHDHVGRYQYPQQQGEPRLFAFADVSSIYRIERSNFMRQIDFIHDFNNDGDSDIMLADFTDLHVWLSQHEGGHKKVSLDIGSHSVLNGVELNASPAQVFTLDLNQDGRLDIANLHEGKLHLYYAHGRHFEHQQLAIRGGIYSIDWWDQLDDDGQPLDQSDLRYRKLERFEDINGDAIPDLVVRYTKSSGVFDRSNDYEIYYGSLDKQRQLSYANKADTTVSAEGTLTDLQLQDIDGDGRLEVMVASFELGVSQVISALLASSIDQDILLYWQNTQGQFPKKPSLDYETEMNFSISKGRASQPLVMLADINGDGRKDLLFSEDNDTLVYRLNQGQQAFARSQKQKLALPQSGSHISSTDINDDGKSDLLLYYGQLDKPELKRRLSLLFAR
ncbi:MULTISPECIES: FG-GAP repeat domain-containing protein [unclassified Pseudoalteromonas]|uniref:FG-GAP repeat domain-containing protein n=1 Tax=unclassified Pseudoalteromonas TaxID=194690 RepID=UPI000CF61A90|nr:MULTISPECIES: VCBS repeat-containing protein [unclassified Pseudoalteromonas]